MGEREYTSIDIKTREIEGEIIKARTRCASSRCSSVSIVHSETSHPEIARSDIERAVLRDMGGALTNAEDATGSEKVERNIFVRTRKTWIDVCERELTTAIAATAATTEGTIRACWNRQASLCYPSRTFSAAARGRRCTYRQRSTEMKLQ